MSAGKVREFDALLALSPDAAEALKPLCSASTTGDRAWRFSQLAGERVPA